LRVVASQSIGQPLASLLFESRLRPVMELAFCDTLR